MEGQTVGKWSVLHRNHNPARNSTGAFWDVKCECGSLSVLSTAELRSGKSNSCKSCGSTKYDYKIDLSDPDWCWLLGLFHADGSTWITKESGGVVTFSCTPEENKNVIQKTLDGLGVVSSVSGDAVKIYSVKLARSLAQFKSSGVDKESWAFPQDPVFWEQWLSGFFDGDGYVSKDGRNIRLYQKPHSGWEKILEVLARYDIAHTLRHRVRDSASGSGKQVENITVNILAKSRNRFKEVVRPRFPKKTLRLSQKTPVGKLIDLTGQSFGDRVVLRRDGEQTPVRWLVRCSCGRVDSLLSQKLRNGKASSCCEDCR